jgi:hypothetical protein
MPRVSEIDSDRGDQTLGVQAQGFCVLAGAPEATGAGR